ncbi:hypothetical protein AXG93_1913s1840 [Marchantia polymorpha subsp. ruderalis]|uniref:Uncharacterized protein n=1 Tax=Marchantia polymorpha subsp. ruderalis TaxID=1480154 RepID=A0A176WL99_MARPO|nr:hypothetical protein AXG93_1913s1840 [Marchantia polymorpha subsp. ruderalis]
MGAGRQSSLATPDAPLSLLPRALARRWFYAAPWRARDVPCSQRNKTTDKDKEIEERQKRLPAPRSQTARAAERPKAGRQAGSANRPGPLRDGTRTRNRTWSERSRSRRKRRRRKKKKPSSVGGRSGRKFIIDHAASHALASVTLKLPSFPPEKRIALPTSAMANGLSLLLHTVLLSCEPAERVRGTTTSARATAPINCPTSPGLASPAFCTEPDACLPRDPGSRSCLAVGARALVEPLGGFPAVFSPLASAQTSAAKAVIPSPLNTCRTCNQGRKVVFALDPLKCGSIQARVGKC